MKLVFPTSRSRPPFSQPGLPNSVGGLIVCAATSAAGAAAGKRAGELVGTISARLLHKQFLGVQHRVDTFNERLAERRANVEGREDRGGLGGYLDKLFLGLITYISKELGKETAVEVWGQALGRAGEAVGIGWGLGWGLLTLNEFESNIAPDPPPPAPVPQPAGEPLPPGLAENDNENPPQPSDAEGDNSGTSDSNGAVASNTEGGEQATANGDSSGGVPGEGSFVEDMTDT
jgi:hypothetical protein